MLKLLPGCHRIQYRDQVIRLARKTSVLEADELTVRK